jgi:hypothetical protein
MSGADEVAQRGIDRVEPLAYDLARVPCITLRRHERIAPSAKYSYTLPPA